MLSTLLGLIVALVLSYPTPTPIAEDDSWWDGYRHYPTDNYNPWKN
jgi:hypothetical protein